MKTSLAVAEADRNKLELQVKELEQSRSKLIDDTHKLLRACKTRDATLARAEERISLLAKPLSQLDQGKPSQEPGKSRATKFPVQHQRMERTVNEAIHERARANGAVMKRELDKDDWLFSGLLRS
jgi:hypothetical protein